MVCSSLSSILVLFWVGSLPVSAPVLLPCLGQFRLEVDFPSGDQLAHLVPPFRVDVSFRRGVPFWSVSVPVCSSASVSGVPGGCRAFPPGGQFSVSCGVSRCWPQDTHPPLASLSVSLLVARFVADVVSAGAGHRSHSPLVPPVSVRQPSSDSAVPPTCLFLLILAKCGGR